MGYRHFNFETSPPRLARTLHVTLFSFQRRLFHFLQDVHCQLHIFFKRNIGLFLFSHFIIFSFNFMSYISPGFHYQFHVFFSFSKNIEFFISCVTSTLFPPFSPECLSSWVSLSSFSQGYQSCSNQFDHFPIMLFFFRPRLARVLLVYSCSIL